MGVYVYLPPPPQRELGAPKITIFKILKCTKTANLIHIKAEWCQKYLLYGKRLQIKVLEHSIFFEKADGRIRPAKGELGGSKDSHFRNIKMYKNGKIDSH